MYQQCISGHYFLFLGSHHHHMVPGNVTQFSSFLLRLSKETELQSLTFEFFPSMYIISVFGNLLNIPAISSDSHLHTPTQFCLSNLPLVAICFVTTTIPKMLVNMQRKVITNESYISHMYFYICFVVSLTMMIYDHLVISHSLH